MLKEPGILLISDDTETGDRVEFIIESRFGYVVYRATSIPEAGKVLRIGTPVTVPIRLLIYNIRGGSFADFEAFQKNFKDVVCIFCQSKGDRSFSIGQSGHGNSLLVIERKKLFGELDTLIGPLLIQSTDRPEETALVDDDTAKLEAKLKLDGTKVTLDDVEFCKIRTTLLLGVIPLHADIFIRLSAQKYLKLFKKGDTFDLADLQKYTVKKGIEYLYLRRNELEDFIRKYCIDLERQAAQEPAITFPDSLQISEAATETIQELGKRIGFTKEIQALAKSQVHLTVRAMGKSPSLRNILRKLQVPGTKYIPAHSMLAPYIACAMASQLEWGSEATFQKLTLAAMLHDISLDNHELAAETDINHVQGSKKYSKEEIKAYQNHSILAAEIARKFTEVPPDVDVIVAQHHERPDGKGFPRGMSSQYISPLACLFIVAHDLTQFCLKALSQGHPPNLSLFLNDGILAYKGANFRKCLTALEAVMEHDRFGEGIK